MKLKLLLITVALFVGCVGVYGQATVFLYSFENTETVTTHNAAETPTFSVSGVDVPIYFLGQVGLSRRYEKWNTGDYYRFTVNTTGYSSLNFSYYNRTSHSAIGTFIGRVSTDAITWTTIIASYTPTANSFVQKTAALPAGFENQAVVYIEIYKTSNPDIDNRNLRIDEALLTGTAIATTIASDHFRSIASGTWATAGNWESSRDNANWITATLAPTSAAKTITIRNLHTITISAAVTADQITVESGGTLALNGADLILNNGTGTDLTINSGGTFDNGGENQITSSGSIEINGKFITRDIDGFVGSNTAITLATRILPTLGSSSIIEYGLNGNQDVQGLTAPTYSNVTFSGSGTKTLISGNNVTGTVTIKDDVIFNNANFTFGGAGTNLTMTGTSVYKLGGSGVKPDSGSTYTLGTSTTMEFTGTSATQIRLAPSYANIIVSGTNVKAGSTDDGGLTFQNPGTFTVKNGAVFKVTNTTGFTGSLNAAIKNTSNPTITIDAGSTIEYAGADQSITQVPNTTAYSNLAVSGIGIKTIPTQLFLGNNLSVNASTLLIESNKTLIVTNNVVVNPAATMTLETNLSNQSASLVQINNTGSNTGNIKYDRNTTGQENDYTYWSTPVAGQTFSAGFPLTKSNKFFSFNAAANDWLQEDPSSTMTAGKGYIISGAVVSGLPVGFTTASFVGTPNNGIIPTPINWDGALDGTSNLIGNPYPSAISADKFLSLNSGVIEGTIYFWTHNTAMQTPADVIAAGGTPGTGILAYTSNDYASYNITGGVGVAAPSALTGGVNTNVPNGKIAAGQAFFTTSLLANGTVTFNNNMRLDNSNNVLDNSQFFKTKNPKETTVFEKHRIWLNLRNTQGVFKQTLIGYITDATNQYDNRFDGETFDGNEFADFYSVNQDKNLVIQGRTLPFDENDQVPLGFRTTIDGAFTINIDQTDGLLANQTVFIEDKLTNIIVDLRTGPYAFTTKSGTFNERFVLRYTNKTLATGDVETLENQVLVSNKNKQIKINSAIEVIDKVTVYDLLGRQLFKNDKVNSNELAIPNFVSSHQMLLVKVSLQNGQTVTRKIMY